MATTISHVLHRASKPPTARVDAYLDRPATGSLVVDELISFISEDPAQLFAIADAALKAGQDLERQQQADAKASGRHDPTYTPIDDIPDDQRAFEGTGGGRRTYQPSCTCGWEGDDDNTLAQAREEFSEHLTEELNEVAARLAKAV